MKKKILLVFVFILLSLAGFSQTQQIEKKGSYEGDGKLFWNKELPITITLSSPDNTTVTLKKPFYLDTEGINFIRTKWEMDSTGKYVYPFHEQLWKIYADSEAPETKIEFIAESSYVYKNKKYYSDDLKVKLTATDKLSGVKKIYYSINGENFKIYENFIIFEAGIDIDLKFYAVDNVGNVEEIEKLSYDYDNNNLNFGIDNSPPITFVKSDGIMLSPKDVIELFSSDENGVGVNATYYKIDSAEYQQYVEPIRLTNIKNGEHKIKYFSQDWINNREDEKEFGFYLDAIAPEITIIEQIIENRLTNIRKIVITATDNISGLDNIYVQLEKDGKFELYTEPLFIDITHQEIKVKATDLVGNESIRIVKYNEIR